ncbi:hypothetical protein Dda_2760 [Drechslerella dactyloides]|uniref:RFTS domain-containing protein n=1 Tax=Drechslerella dactyloides TaxID=74499 RepID=A0AAD6J4G7_DREDA|nr:hypothetical protein Dda_2760 [Drechslerella dactyloides]
MLETHALKEQNPKIVHPDDWPTCDLYDAIVTSKKSSHKDGLIDLLDVLEKGPFHVKGRIRTIPDELQEFVRNQNLVNCDLLIANVRRWSIERLPDEKIIIWALGNAAWYGIHPAKSYQEIYDTMLQKAAIYNFIVDKYGSISAKGPRLRTTMEAVYTEMAENPVVGSVQDAEKLVRTHRRFVIAQLLEDTRYKRTPFWRYMLESYHDEIEEVQAVIDKVTKEIQNATNEKAERLSKSPQMRPAKAETSPPRRVTRNRSGTASSGASEAETSSKRKSRDHSTDEPGSRRRKTSAGDISGKSRKSTPPFKLGHKSRRSNRIVAASESPPALEAPGPSSQERVVLSGRATRNTRPSQHSPTFHTDSTLQTSFPSASTLTASTSIDIDIDPTPQALPTLPRQPPAEPPVAQPPPIPKPSIETLKEVIKDSIKDPQKPVEKVIAAPTTRTSRHAGSKGTAKAAPKTSSPPRKAASKAAPARIATGSSSTSRPSTRTQKNASSSDVVPLDENQPGYDDLRDQAISKLIQQHSMYQKISKTDSQPEYLKFMEFANETAEWRKQHGLKPVYIDVIYATGYYSDEITDESVIRRVPGTEYLVDTMEWDFDTAVELLQNVNRGTYIHELLQPVKEARRNARLRAGKAPRGRPRKVAAPEEIETSMSSLKISSVPPGVSIKGGASVDVSWECLGYDEKGQKCSFIIEDAASFEGARKASDHWRVCPLRKHATEETLAKKRDNIEQAQTVLRDQQVRDPWTNIDNLVNFLEGEANKSRSWFPAVDTMGKAKLRQILAAEKGKVPYLEKQKKLQKEARKRKRKLAEDEEEDDEMEVDDVAANGVEGDGDEEEWEDESESDEGRVIDTSKLDDSDSEDDSEDDDEEDDDDDEDVPVKGILKPSKPTPTAHQENGDEEDDEEDEEDDEDIPLSEISEDDHDPDADIIPRQKLTINNHPALLAARAAIALPITPSTPFSTHHTLTSASATSSTIADVHDDVARELAFYTQALDAARRGRDLLLAEGAPFTRPTDYFAEMVKSEEHMGRVKDKLKEEAARKQASTDAKRQRELKKFGKAVQVARLQERHKEKREMLDKISLLKRKRAGADLGDENEGDPFDIAIEKATKETRNSRTDRGAPNAKRQRKNEKFGFGGRKKFAKSGDAASSGDMSGFSAKGMKRNSFGGSGGGGKKKPAMRPGKSKRQARR